MRINEYKEKTELDLLIWEMYYKCPIWKTYNRYNEDYINVYKHEENGHLYFHYYWSYGDGKHTLGKWYAKLFEVLSIPYTLKAFAIVFYIPDTISINNLRTAIKLININI